MCRPKHVELHINIKNKILTDCCILLDFSLRILASSSNSLPDGADYQ